MKSNRLKQIASLLALLATAGTLESQASSQATAQNREAARLAREVRHELLTLPWYGVFDWLEGSVTADGRVTLRGWVVSPTTRSDAENRVREIEGVQQLSNEIRVLPVSPNDERLRRAVYEALFGGNSPLFRYALGSNPSIHVIIDQGRVTLKGLVSTDGDRSLAIVRAKGVSGVFDVTNELTLDKQ